MKTYTVLLPVTGTASIQVRAENEGAAIDAALSADLSAENLDEWEAIREVVRGNVFYGYPTGLLPRGAIVATCRLVNVLPTEVVNCADNVFGISLPPLTAQEKAFGDYSAGRYALILEDVKLFPEPIPAKGSLGLWEWSDYPGECASNLGVSA